MHIPSTQKFKFYFVYFSLLIIFIYFALVICNFFLQRYISKHNESEITQAKIIERDRTAKEDVLQRKLAIKDGYKPLFYPETIDNYLPLRKLAIELDVAPLAPQPNSSLYFCNEGYGLIKYKTDRFGFRNSNEQWDKKVDALLIGDSFTHGACVEDKDTISANLNDKFNTLNLGTYGNHAIHYAAVEKTFIPIVKPKYVITIFYANDNEDDVDSVYWNKSYSDATKYFESSNSYTSLSSKVKDFYTKADYLIDNLLSGEQSPDDFIKKYSHTGFLEKSLKYFSLPTIRKTFINYAKANGYIGKLPYSNVVAIDTLITSCQQNGCIPMVAYIPNSNFWRPDARATHYSKLLAEYCKTKGIQFIDTTKLIDDLGDKAFAPKGPHLSPIGYRVVANALRNNLSTDSSKPTSQH